MELNRHFHSTLEGESGSTSLDPEGPVKLLLDADNLGGNSTELPGDKLAS